MRDLVHLSLDAAAVAVAHSLLNQQDPSSWGNGLDLNGDLLALGLLRGRGPVVAGCHGRAESGLEQAEERSWNGEYNASATKWQFLSQKNDLIQSKCLKVIILGISS